MRTIEKRPVAPRCAGVRGGRGHLVVATLVVATLVGGSVVMSGASTGSSAALQSVSFGQYTGVLANLQHHTYYALSVERHGTLHCTGSCLAFWFPLLVKNSVHHVTLEAGVAGKIGFIQRSSKRKQVTFNGFPLYLFSGDSGPSQGHGQGIPADGGTWYLVNAAARTGASTQERPSTTTTTTTTTTVAPTTTTTAGSGTTTTVGSGTTTTTGGATTTTTIPTTTTTFHY